MRSRFATRVLGPALVLAAIAQSAFAGEGDRLYRDGHYDRALEAWQVEASAGDARAAWRLAVAMNDGIVVERDATGAVRWLRVAAAAGLADAQVDLGTAFDRGEGVDASPVDAAHWYHRAARQGHVAGQFNLGSMYEQGQGVDRDLEEAWAWYSLAVRQGIGQIGERAVERVSSRLSAAALARADDRARRYETAYLERTSDASSSRPD